MPCCFDVIDVDTAVRLLVDEALLSFCFLLLPVFLLLSSHQSYSCCCFPFASWERCSSSLEFPDLMLKTFMREEEFTSKARKKNSSFIIPLSSSALSLPLLQSLILLISKPDITSWILVVLIPTSFPSFEGTPDHHRVVWETDDWRNQSV